MNEVENIRLVLHLSCISRCTGRTEVVKKWAKDNNGIVICANEQHARLLGAEGLRACSMYNTKYLCGSTLPIMIDHFAMECIISKLLELNFALGSENMKLHDKLTEIQKIAGV